MSRIFLFVCLLCSLELLSQADLPRLDSLMEVAAERGNFNGNILIAQNGKAAYRRSFGYANLDTKQALNDATAFRLASLSKQFTALGIAVLENDGKLDFDDPLAKYIPEMATYKGVTIRHLIHHYGGLPDYMSLVWRKGNSDLVYDNDMIIALMAAKKPRADFAPGTRFSYSNTGYLLLASVIERISGQTYGKFLQERVFMPLGMTRTAVNYPEARQDENVAAGFEADPKTKKMIRVDNGGDPFSYGLLAGIFGDGAVFSTTDDLLRYHLGMQTDKVLPVEKRAALVTAGKLEKAPDNGYAFGQQVKSTDALGLRISHSGSWAGAITWLERYPENGSAVAILSNNNADFTTLRMLSSQLLEGQELRLPKVFSPAEVTAKQLVGYPGDYQLRDDLILTITTKKNKLYLEPTGQRKYPMTPYASDGFYLEGTTISFQFRKDANGKVTGLTYEQDGKVIECERL